MQMVEQKKTVEIMWLYSTALKDKLKLKQIN